MTSDNPRVIVVNPRVIVINPRVIVVNPRVIVVNPRVIVVTLPFVERGSVKGDLGGPFRI